MPLTLHDIKPVGLCVTTQELFDTKRFLLNFCDGLIIRGKDRRLRNELTDIKKKLNTFQTKGRFFNGYKAVITSNIDKILGLVTSRYFKKSPKKVERIIMDGKDLIKKLIKAKSFEDIKALEDEFKTKITLPTYQIFIDDLKRANIRVI